MFQSLTLKYDIYVSFGGDPKGRIIGRGSINNKYSPSINNVFLVQGLEHNLLSINQLCYSGYDMVSNQKECKAVNQVDGYIFFNRKRKYNIYKVRLSDLLKQNVKCLMSVDHEEWISHKQLDDTLVLERDSTLVKSDFPHWLMSGVVSSFNGCRKLDF